MRDTGTHRGSVSLCPTETNVAIWYQWTAGLNENDLELARALLSPKERVRSGQFVFERDRRDYIAAHALLRNALSRYGPLQPSEWEFCTGRHGKPALVSWQSSATGLSFNLSHTHGLVACVVAGVAQVGIDVELVDRANLSMEVAEGFFALPELALLRESRPEDYDQTFVELWTLREAYIKAVGMGLGMRFDSFAFRFEGDSDLVFEAADEIQSWQFWVTSLSDAARLAVAVSDEVTHQAWRLTFNHHGRGGDRSPSVVRSTARDWSILLGHVGA